ncbi:hypothetical protein MRX96_016492 [Rhipicephalus microplus]
MAGDEGGVVCFQEELEMDEVSVSSDSNFELLPVQGSSLISLLRRVPSEEPVELGAGAAGCHRVWVIFLEDIL